MRETLLTTMLATTLTMSAQEQAPMLLQYDRPADFFEESLPIGNGKLGALVYSGTDDNIIYLNDITLWTGKPVDRNLDADAHQWIPKIREALFNTNWQTHSSYTCKVPTRSTSNHWGPFTLRIWGLAQLAITIAVSASTLQLLKIGMCVTGKSLPENTSLLILTS